MRCLFRSLAYLVLPLLFVAGCQKFKDERTVKLGPNEVSEITIDAPKSDQKVKVEVKSDQPVNVYIVTEEVANLGRKLKANKEIDKSKIVGSKEKVTDDTVEGTVPAKKEFGILIKAGSKGASLTVKTTGG